MLCDAGRQCNVKMYCTVVHTVASNVRGVIDRRPARPISWPMTIFGMLILLAARAFGSFLEATDGDACQVRTRLVMRLLSALHFLGCFIIIYFSDGSRALAGGRNTAYVLNRHAHSSSALAEPKGQGKASFGGVMIIDDSLSRSSI